MSSIGLSHVCFRRATSLFIPALMCMVGALLWPWAAGAQGSPYVSYNHSSSTNAGSSAVSGMNFTFTVASTTECDNSLLLVPIGLMQGIGNVSPTATVTWDHDGTGGDSPVPLTLNDEATGSSSTDDNKRKRVEMWYLEAPTPGTGTIDIQMPSGETAEMIGGAIQVCGVDQISPFVNQSIVARSTPATNNPITASSGATGALVIDLMVARQ